MGRYKTGGIRVKQLKEKYVTFALILIANTGTEASICLQLS